MTYHQPFQVAGFHSCDKEVGLKVLNGEMDLNLSVNPWDWLGGGICLNLLESGSLAVVKKGYDLLVEKYAELNKNIPFNKGPRRELDCAVISYVHELVAEKGFQPYDSVRSAFQEGGEIYKGSNFTDRLHIELCVINKDMIKGYFLPRPIDAFNPHLRIAA